MHTMNNPAPPSYEETMGESTSAKNNSASNQPTSNIQELSQMSDSYPSSSSTYLQSNNFSNAPPPYPVDPSYVSIESIQQNQSANIPPHVSDTIIIQPVENSKTIRNYVILRTLGLVLGIISIIIIAARISVWVS